MMDEISRLTEELLFIRNEDPELYRNIVREILGGAHLLRIYKEQKQPHLSIVRKMSKPDPSKK